MSNWGDQFTRRAKKPVYALGESKTKTVVKAVRKIATKQAYRVVHKTDELKQCADQPANGNIDNNQGNIFQIVNPVVGGTNNLQQGTGRNQRVGDLIYIKSFKVGWTSFIRATLLDATYRVIIVYDKQAQLTACNLAQILSPETTAATYTISQNYNVDNVPSRFRILYDKTFNHKLSSNAISAVTIDLNPVQHTIRKRFKGAGLKVQFARNSAGAGIAAIEQGAITMFFVQGGSAATASLAWCGMTKDIVFTDA